MSKDQSKIFHHLFNAIKVRKRFDCPFLVFISGIDCSGKTYFSQALQNFIVAQGGDVQLVHLDDFHHPRKYRYTESKDLASQYYYCSFNIDRLINEVIQPIKSERCLDKSITVLDLEKDAFISERNYVVRPSSIVILEGVFLGRPSLRSFCDLFIQIEVPLTIAFNRAKFRDVPKQGDFVLQKYICKYFPAQLRYMRDHKPAYKADYIIDNIDFNTPKFRKKSMGVPFYLEKTAEKFAHKAQDPAIDLAAPLQKHFDVICFDFWNTLVPLSKNLKEEAFQKTASLLGIDSEVLRPIWQQSRQQRETMELKDFLDELCRDLGIVSCPNLIEEVMRERYILHGSAISSLCDDAELTLRMLREAGYQLGLVSNCTSDVPEMLSSISDKLSFDVTVFSCFEGVMKPARDIFLRVSERLGVSPSRCLYVGDGNDNELEGAKLTGMTPVLLEKSQKIDWNGFKIKSLSDLLYLLII
jgi:FMN phosphatase YigB (HAD superfamily)/uridine kinase